MAERDLVGAIAKQPAGVKIGIVVGMMVIMAGLYWQFFYSSLTEELDTEKRKRASLMKKNKTLKDRERRYEDLVKKKNNLDATKESNQVSLPTSADLPSFFLNLQKQAGAAGVQIVSWKVEREALVETYFKVPVSIELSGNFYQINNYFRLLAGTQRITTIEDLSLTNPTLVNNDLILTAKFRAATFRQSDPGPQSKKKEAQKPKGGKAAVQEANQKRANQLDGAANGGKATKSLSPLAKPPEKKGSNVIAPPKTPGAP